MRALMYPHIRSVGYLSATDVYKRQTVVRMFGEMNRGPHAVRETLQKYCGEEQEQEWIFS